MARPPKRPKQIRTGTAVTVWMSNEEIKALDTLVEQTRLDRSKVLKFLVGLHSPKEFLALYMEDLNRSSRKSDEQPPPTSTADSARQGQRDALALGGITPEEEDRRAAFLVQAAGRSQRNAGK